MKKYLQNFSAKAGWAPMATIETIAKIVCTTELERFNAMPESETYRRTAVIFNQIIMECKILLSRHSAGTVDCLASQKIDIAVVDYRLMREALTLRLGDKAALVFTEDF